VSWTAPIPDDLFQFLAHCQIEAGSLPEVSA